MKKLAYSLLSIFTFCFITVLLCYLDEKTYSPSSRLSNLVKKYSDQIESKEKIILRSYGFQASSDPNYYGDGKIHIIDLMYNIDKGMYYKEGREFFYKLADNLLEEINSTEQLKDILFNYPATYKDLHLILSFDYHDKGFLLKDQLLGISVDDNKIMYVFASKDGDIGEIETNQISQDIFIIADRPSIKNWIRRPLPEKEF